jgi:hypothetical protein
MLGSLFEQAPNRSAASHIAYPHGGDVRYALPVDTDCGSAALHFLTTRRGRAALALRRAGGWFISTPPPWLVATVGLTEIASFAGYDEIDRVAVAAGTPGPYNKPAVLFLNAHGEPTAIAKVAENEVNRGLLRNEAGWLDRWDSADLMTGRLPTKIRLGEVGHITVLLQTVGKGPILKLNAPVTQGHLDILSAIQGSGSDAVPFLGSAMNKALHRRFAACRDPRAPPTGISRPGTCGIRKRACSSSIGSTQATATCPSTTRSIIF